MNTYKLNSYTKFSCQPVKVRVQWIKERLVILGYLKDGDSAYLKRDKPYIKALIKYQDDNGLTPNADFSEDLFNLLKNV